MNSVHLVTQEKYRVKKLGRNEAKCTSTKTGPTEHPGTPRCAQAWSYRGRAWPCHGGGPRPYRSSRLPCHSVVRAPLRAVLRAPCPTPQRRVAGCPSAVSWPAWSYRRHKAARLAGRVLGWLCCIATQPNLSSLGLPQYNWFVLRYRLPH